jgi:uncharacterized protein YxjI
MLGQSSYFIREHVGFMKLTDTYDILNPETQEQIGFAREEISGSLKLLRFIVGKQLLPTTVRVYKGNTETPGELQFSMQRGFSLFRPKIQVLNGNAQPLGYFKSKIFSLGGAFRVFSNDDEEIALVKGNWKGWNFKFLSGDLILGEVTKKWSGLGKELFTSADNYMITINGEPSQSISTLLLASGLAIDMVLKESN